jgi:hypothetical protein
MACPGSTLPAGYGGSAPLAFFRLGGVARTRFNTDCAERSVAGQALSALPPKSAPHDPRLTLARRRGQSVISARCPYHTNRP